ncbi:hypothetical protein YC2023_115707 [Brassica napus]
MVLRERNTNLAYTEAREMIVELKERAMKPGIRERNTKVDIGVELWWPLVGAGLVAASAFVCYSKLSRRRPPVFRCSASVGGGCLPCFLRSSLFSFVSPPSLPLLLVDMQFVVDFSPVSLSGGYKSGAVIFVVAGPSGLSGGALSLVWFFWRPLAWLMTRTCVLSKGVSVLGSLRRPFFSHHQCEIVVVGVDFGSLTSDSVVVVSCYRRFFGVGGCGLFLWLEGDYVRPMSMSEILFLVGVGCGALMKRIGWIFPVWCIVSLQFSEVVHVLVHGVVDLV